MKKKTHEEFLIELEKKQPKIYSSTEIVGEYVNLRTKILAKTRYGEVMVRPESLLSGFVPSIQSAVDKNLYFKTSEDKYEERI